MTSLRCGREAAGDKHAPVLKRGRRGREAPWGLQAPSLLGDGRAIKGGMSAQEGYRGVRGGWGYGTEPNWTTRPVTKNQLWSRLAQGWKAKARDILIRMKMPAQGTRMAYIKKQPKETTQGRAAWP